MKRCAGCQELKDLDAFASNRARKDGKQHYCRACCAKRYVENRELFNARSADWSRRNRERLTQKAYWKRHGLLERPSGACEICGQVGKLVVDHDHACCPANQSCAACRRGAICNPCNAGLGRFRDDPESLRRAADYLERWFRNAIAS